MEVGINLIKVIQALNIYPVSRDLEIHLNKLCQTALIAMEVGVVEII